MREMRYEKKNADRNDDIGHCFAGQSGAAAAHCTGVVAYSLSKYCLNNAKPGKAMQALAAATAMYGYYAAQYFA